MFAKYDVLLYDRANDPDEMHNLAADLAYRKVLEEYNHKLEALISSEIGEDARAWVTEKPQLLGWPTWRGDSAA